ncbi:rRNA cytosine-C5-methyltransferase [Candidatus Uhrbacteria bacterium CG_4_10_14_0_2_um_filter_41_7]|uniref:rRNA cytosine-C5-methyltransferase n=1 Tax=Candidatus Uhrbacteria bacterium CG_4_9_14_3_um_filter_41_35 TaxID=1975034 RepID=A0A2M7XF36_9BACT|nr:MAG: rRNA cytosine-C5-methyltransferase [Candidatus Uhrbacteria bacterium CG11_big_fil_rev_8_21_14_0_20_41_9]PIZ54073.1 MAG: rRNA cytosine-C5-methyltransferase [Candidatus Uhrbacteria bacterium CG_4_10_14_0_2_um_filter_41_7]PJA46465.1 MAG: rRNA cytosine-C5-methyltransferase [Candidatus Uhrbacteria bacterium CG_4_9_14_3_um_filter_41_35]
MAKKTYRLPEEFLERLNAQFGPFKAGQILKAFETERPTTFRTNTLKSTDEKTMDFLRSGSYRYERIKTIPHAFRAQVAKAKDLLETEYFKEGNAYMQGETSMLPPLYLEPKPGDTVLDLCAAPGGKTSQIAALMKNEGVLVACEDDEIRYQKLVYTLQNQGVKIAKALKMDAAVLYKEMPETFDLVLADVPCSAEGRISVHDLRTFSYWSKKNIIAHAKMQRRLLRGAVACLKPGGTLVYSTCTLAPEENELMVEWLLETYPEMKLLEPVNLTIPTKEREGFFVAKVGKKKIKQ